MTISAAAGQARGPRARQRIAERGKVLGFLYIDGHRIIERIPHSHTYRITTTTTLRYCTVNCVGSTTAWASAL